MSDFWDLPWWLRIAIAFAVGGPIITGLALQRIERRLSDLERAIHDRE
jgi:hypothetical protein